MTISADLYRYCEGVAGNSLCQRPRDVTSRDDIRSSQASMTHNRLRSKITSLDTGWLSSEGWSSWDVNIAQGSSEGCKRGSFPTAPSATELQWPCGMLLAALSSKLPNFFFSIFDEYSHRASERLKTILFIHCGCSVKILIHVTWWLVLPVPNGNVPYPIIDQADHTS